MGVRNYLVEGVSGTGKTSVCDELNRRGHLAIHGDRELAYQGDPVTGEPTDTARHDHHIWDVRRVRDLVADQSAPVTFFCGGSRNFASFIDLFDGVFVLEVDLETLHRRLDQRPPDEWGSKPSERELVVRLHETREDVPQTGAVVDATGPLADVVDEILLRAGLRLAIDTSQEPSHSRHMNSTETAPVQYVVRPEGRVAFELQGSGPLVVLVPGMGELRSSYRFLAPELVAAGYSVATTELRGHGDSDATFTAFGDEATAGDVAALIEQVGGPAVIVGNSLAAGAGVIVAAEHPEAVSGLVLVGPFVRNPAANKILLAMFRAMTAPLWVARAWKGYLPTLYAGQKPADFADYRASVYASLRRPAYGKAFSQTTRQTDHDPAEARLADVSVPVLVVMGDKDPDFKDPAAEARWIGETLDAEVVIVEDAGHYPHSQQPQVTSAAVLSFLAKVAKRA